VLNVSVLDITRASPALPASTGALDPDGVDVGTRREQRPEERHLRVIGRVFMDRSRRRVKEAGLRRTRRRGRSRRITAALWGCSATDCASRSLSSWKQPPSGAASRSSGLITAPPCPSSTNLVMTLGASLPSGGFCWCRSGCPSAGRTGAGHRPPASRITQNAGRAEVPSAQGRNLQRQAWQRALAKANQPGLGRIRANPHARCVDPTDRRSAARAVRSAWCCA
jgi:hypothetical protein